MSFVQRALSFIFTRQDGSSFSSGAKSITLPPGLMAQVRITNAGMPGMGGAQTSIWGLTPSIMAELSTLNIRVTLQAKNYMTIRAMDGDGTNSSTAFFGGIRMSAPDYNRQPDPCLSLFAMAGVEVSTLPPVAQGYNGGVDLITVLQDLCSKAGYTLENNGVSGISVTNYSWGDPRSAILELRNQVINQGVDIEFDIQGEKTVAVWYLQKARSSPSGVPLISAGTAGAQGNMIGYPTFTEFGVDVRCVYNPGVRRGAQVQVQSSIPTASGLFRVDGVAHALDTQIPGGKWETTVQGTRFGYPTPVVNQLG